MDREEQLKIAHRNYERYRQKLRREMEDEFIADWVPMSDKEKTIIALLVCIVLAAILLTKLF